MTHAMMRSIPVRSVAVFCGSNVGHDPAFAVAARQLGDGLGRAGIRLVYGGGQYGLMGVLATAAIEAGGAVTGIIPAFLGQLELAHTGLDELIVVDTMHERKALIVARADAIIALPGGFGTMDELLEALTWRLLGLHTKPVLICNVSGWAASLIGAFDAAIANGFAGAAIQRAYTVLPDAASLLAHLHR